MKKALILFLSITLFSQSRYESELLQYARQLYEDQLYELAITQLDRYAQLYPNSDRLPEILMMKGDSYFRMDQFDLARKAFQEVDIRYPGTLSGADALFRVGICLEKISEVEMAAEHYRRYPVFYPENVHTTAAYFRASQIFTDLHKFEKATSVLNELIHSEISDSIKVRAEMQQANIHYLSGFHEEANRIYTNLLPLLSDDETIAAVQFRLGLLFVDMENDISASKAFEEVLVRSNDAELLAKTHNAIGEIQYREWDFSAAMDSYADAHKLTDVQQIQSKAMIGIGDVFVAMGDIAAAFEQYKKYLETQDDLIINLKAGYVQTLFNESPKKYFEKILASEQDFSLLQAVIQFYSENASYDDDFVLLIKMLRRAIQTAPENLDSKQKAQLHFQLAEIFRNVKNRYDSALIEYEMAVSEPCFSDESMFKMAECYFELGEYQNAFGLYKKLTEEMRESPFLHRAEYKIRLIEEHFLVSERTGFGNLTELVGQMVTDENPMELTLSLARIHFYDLKDYPRTRELIQSLLETEPVDSVLTIAYELLAQLERRLWDKFLYLNDAENAEKAFQRGENIIQKMKQNGLNQAAISAILDWNRFQNQPVMFFDELDSQTDSEILQKALDFTQKSEQWQTILDLTDSTSAQNQSKFSFERGLAQLKTGKRDEAFLSFARYLNENPRGNFRSRAIYESAKIAAENGEWQKVHEIANFETIAEYSEYNDSMNVLMDKKILSSENWTEICDVLDNREKSLQQKLFGEVAFDLHPEIDLISANAFLHQEKWMQTKAKLMPYITGVVADSDLKSAIEFWIQLPNEYATLESKIDLIESNRTLWMDLEQSLILNQLAKFYRDLGDYEKSDAVFGEIEEMTQNEEEKETAFWGRIVNSIRQGKMKKAKDWFVSFGEKFGKTKKSEEYYVEKIRYELENELYDDAEMTMKKFLDSYPRSDQSAFACFHLGEIYLTAERFDEAISMLVRVPSLPNNTDVIDETWLLLGSLYHRLENLDLAINAYKNAIGNANETIQTTALKNLIQLYQEVGLIDAAISSAKAYLQKNPDAKDKISISIQIGSMYIVLKEYDRAISQLENIAENANTEERAEIQFYIAEAYFEKGEFLESIAQYLKIPYLHRNTKLDWSVSALWKAGQAYEKLGDFNQAALMYQRIITERGLSSNYGRHAQKRIDELRLEGKI